MAKLKLFHLGTAGKTDHLVAQADAKQRHLANELLHLRVVGDCRRNAERVRAGVDLDRDRIERAGELQKLHLPRYGPCGLPVLAVGVRKPQRQPGVQV